MSAPQFYETAVLLSSEETAKWLRIITSPPTLPKPLATPPGRLDRETQPHEMTDGLRESVIEQYRGLIGEASRVFPIPAHRLHEAVEMLIETSDRSRRSAISKFQYWFGPESAREPLRRAREARRFEYGARRPGIDAEERLDEFYELEVQASRPVMGAEHDFVWQALTLDIVPLEASPLSKTSLARVSAGGATLTVCFFTGGPVLLAIGTMGLIACAVGSALWKGAEPEVVEFGGDVTATLLDAIRARLGIQRRKH